MLRKLVPAHRAALAIVAATVACNRLPGAVASAPPLPEPGIVADTTRIATVAPGVKHRYYWIARGPWAVNVLDVDRSACWTPVAIKGRPRAIGREKTSVLVSAYADSARRRGVAVAGGVNADFFLFAPPGVPVGAHIHRSRMYTGPVDRPILAVNDDGSLHLGPVTHVVLAQRGDQFTALRWNHPVPGQISFVDRLYGERTDTATGALELVLRESPTIALAPPRDHPEGSRRIAGVVTRVDTSRDGVGIPTDGFLVTAGARVDSANRAFLRTLAIGDTVMISHRFVGAQPREAVGGFPMLLRSGTMTGDVHTANSAGFRARNPRTAVGVGADKRRLLLVTVDGRQQGFSEGMTLEELANLMRDLGAADALNLDGGGSTTFVVADSAGAFAVRNRPSDREGERPVANAVAVERVCGARTR